MQKQIDRQTLTLFLSGDLDMSNADDFKKAIDQDIERRKIRRVILDMSQVTFIDSSALGVILGRYKKLKTLNGSLEIANAPPHIFRILSMSGLPKIIAFTSDGKEILS